VYAHQDPKTSFNASLKDVTIEELTKQGYEVEVSDLYAQNFDPRATRKDFIGKILMSINKLSRFLKKQ